MNWRELTLDEQEALLDKSLKKLSMEQLVELVGITREQLVWDLMDSLFDDDDAFIHTMDEIEESLGDKFYD